MESAVKTSHCCEERFCVYAIVLGATVYLVCRNIEKGEDAKREIIQNSGNEVVSLHRGSLLESVNGIFLSESRITHSGFIQA